MSEPQTLAELEAFLIDSHNQTAMQTIAAFASSLGKTQKRQAVFNQAGALLRPPIDYVQAQQQGILDDDGDLFYCLQGDLIETSAAFFINSSYQDVL